MYLISPEGYKNAGVHILIIKKTGEIWPSMKCVGSDMGVKNISAIVLKERYGICETKNPTKEQVNEYKIIEREIYENFGRADELNTKGNKSI